MPRCVKFLTLFALGLSTLIASDRPNPGLPENFQPIYTRSIDFNLRLPPQLREDLKDKERAYYLHDMMLERPRLLMHFGFESHYDIAAAAGEGENWLDLDVDIAKETISIGVNEPSQYINSKYWSNKGLKYRVSEDFEVEGDSPTEPFVYYIPFHLQELNWRLIGDEDHALKETFDLLGWWAHPECNLEVIDYDMRGRWDASWEGEEAAGNAVIQIGNDAFDPVRIVELILLDLGVDKDSFEVSVVDMDRKGKAYCFLTTLASEVEDHVSWTVRMSYNGESSEGIVGVTQSVSY